METGETSMSRGARPPRRRPAPPVVQHGKVDITVNLEALCWDTFGPDGSDTDRGLEGVLVAINPTTGPLQTQMTDADGLAHFENLALGAASVRAVKTDFVHDHLRSEATTTVTVAAGAAATATLTLRGIHNACTRKHVAKPAGTPGLVTLMPLFWADEPWILLLRDVLWLVMLVGGTLLMALGLWPPTSICLAAGALCFAICAYANHVIFGMIPGVIVIALAFATFLAIVIFTILALLTTPPLPVANPATGAFGMPVANIFFFPPLCAIWIGFTIGLAAGRQETFSHKDWGVVIAATIVAALLAVVIFILVYFFSQKATFLANPGYVVAGVIVHLIAGAAMGFIGGLMGHTFINDGDMKDPVWGLDDLALPYAGERYCVQGHRGFISHFLRTNNAVRDDGTPYTWVGDEEYCYDWSMPEGEPILAAKEGHIVLFREDKDGSVSSNGNEIANYVYVRHKDGTMAEYLHLRKDGFTEVNPAVAALGVTEGEAKGFRGNPVHCWEGQRLAAAGNVGISMFSHLHFTVKRATAVGGRRFMPVKFADADVAVHEGRCFSMRKYRSSNMDRGRVVLP